MKNNIQNKRIIAIIIAINLAMPSIFITAQALSEEATDSYYNYVDLIESYTIVNADTVKLNLTMPSVALYHRYENEQWQSDFNKLIITQPFKDKYQDYSATLFRGPDKNFLWIRNIPDGTYMSFSYNYKLVDGENAQVGVPQNKVCLLRYVNNGQIEYQEELQLEQGNVLYFGFQFNKNEDYQAIDIDTTIYGLQYNYVPPVEFTLTNMEFKMQISSLQYEAIQDEKTQKLLEDVNKNLEAVQENQKQYGEEILYGETLNDHNVNGPGGFNDKVDQQGEQVQNGLEEINKIPKPDADSAIPDIQAQVPAEGANLLSTIMGGITGYSFIPTYLMIVVGLFVISFIMFGKKEN